MLLRLPQLLNPEVMRGKSPTQKLCLHGKQEEITDMKPPYQDMAPQGTIPSPLKCRDTLGHFGSPFSISSYTKIISPLSATKAAHLRCAGVCWNPSCHRRLLTFSRVCTNWSMGMEPLSNGFKDLHSGTSSLTLFLFLLAGGWGGFGGS